MSQNIEPLEFYESLDVDKKKELSPKIWDQWKSEWLGFKLPTGYYKAMKEFAWDLKKIFSPSKTEGDMGNFEKIYFFKSHANSFIAL